MKLGIKSKLVLSIVFATVIIFSVIIGYISINSKTRELDKTYKYVDEQAKSSANLVQSIINVDLGVVRTMARTFENYNTINKHNRSEIFNNVLTNILSKNPEYLGTYCQFELSALDEKYISKEGRVRTVYYYDGANMILQQDTVDRNGVSKQTSYHLAKRTGLETIENPYEFVYSNNKTVLETSISSPIKNNDQFVGIAGMDISLERFRAMIDPIKPLEESFAFLIANNGHLVTFPDPAYVGKSIIETGTGAEEYDVIRKIKEGKAFSHIFQYNGKTEYHSYAPVTIGDTQTPWSLCIMVPLKIITKDINNSFLFALLLGIIGFVLLAILVWLISLQIASPVIKITGSLNTLAKGDVSSAGNINIKSKDQIGEMVTAMNTLSQSLAQSVKFASTIGKGDFSAEYKLKGDNDEFGKALILMRDNLNKLSKKNEGQVWINEGQNGLNKKIRGEQSIKKLTDNIISYLCEYMEVQVGVLYIYNENPGNIEISGTYAYRAGKSKILNLGEGLAGQVAIDKRMIIIKDIPRDSLEISSALGKTKPSNILAVPFLFENELKGVMELGFIKTIPDRNIRFINTILETIAIAINSAQANEKLKQLSKR